VGANFTHFYSFQVYFYAYNVFLKVGLSPSQTRYVSLGVGITEILTTALCVSGSSAEFHSAAVPVSFQPLETTANGDPGISPLQQTNRSTLHWSHTTISPASRTSRGHFLGPAPCRSPAWLLKAAAEQLVHSCETCPECWQQMLLFAGLPGGPCWEEGTAMEIPHCYGLGVRTSHHHTCSTGKASLMHLSQVTHLHVLLHGRHQNYFPSHK